MSYWQLDAHSNLFQQATETANATNTAFNLSTYVM